MASVCILVTSAPLVSQGSYAAFRFASAALDAGHTVAGVFFYHDGVLNGNALRETLSDELDIYTLWESLVNSHELPLFTCVTAANRRGIVNLEDSPIAGNYSLAAPFASVGLGELAKLIAETDRLVQF